ncbi:DUF1007 family protein [Tardiphaga alba]|uniref:DUF1007 family protein n=1 Tax=Tardiphaga alba TaxID=340268 RepID=UPI001BADF7B7
MIRRLFGLCALLAVSLGGIATAAAHPHVFVAARSELLYAPDGTITGVRHAWTFDDMFSTYALQGIPSKVPGQYTREELAPLAQTNVESLQEYKFFTFAEANGKKELFNDPVDYYLEKTDAGLTLHFTLPFKAPFKTKQLALEVFDPSYFIDFGLEKTDPIKLVGAPASCTMAIQRPSDGGAAKAQTMNEDTFMNGENSNFGAMFANKVTVDCP